MTKQEYININFDQHLYYWSNIAIGFGTIVILSLAPLDYIVAPMFFSMFYLTESLPHSFLQLSF